MLLNETVPQWVIDITVDVSIPYIGLDFVVVVAFVCLLVC